MQKKTTTGICVWLGELLKTPTAIPRPENVVVVTATVVVIVVVDVIVP